MPWPRIVLHVDMDAFFAAVEQRDRPELQGKPLIVGADPLEGRGRGVVATCSYEARVFGVRSGMPISQAYRLCPEGVYVRPDFGKYVETSRRILRLASTFADVFEPAGLDEAYMDVTAKAAEFGGAEALAKALKEAVRAQERLTCSVGISVSKSVAKIASDFRKPDGLTVVPPEEVPGFLRPLPVRRLSGVGPKTEERLKAMAIATIGDLADTPPTRLSNTFGEMGLWLWRLAHGIDERPVAPWEGPPASVSEEETFPEDTRDAALVKGVIDAMVESLVSGLRGDGLAFRTVTLKWRTGDFATVTRSTTTRWPSQSAEWAKGALDDLARPLLADPRPVRLVGVRFSHLSPVAAQRTLDSWL